MAAIAALLIDGEFGRLVTGRAIQPVALSAEIGLP